MASGQISIQVELTQQVWGATNTFTADRELGGQLKPNVVQQNPVSHIDDDASAEIESLDGSTNDEDFGEFETVNSSTDDESWVSVNYNQVEDMTSGVADLAAYAHRPTLENFEDSENEMSPPPSPLPRGYLRSTQNVDAFLHPMDLTPENSALGNLLSFESSSYDDYAPLFHADSGSGYSAKARHGTSTERMWSLGKTAFSRLASARQGAGKQAKQAVAAWKTNFVDKEHEELARVVKEAAKVPMVVKTEPTSVRDRSHNLISGAVANEDGVKNLHMEYAAESWMDVERRAWGA
ncbi:uncharacterized protein N0V89_009975 [Didymosphaeria variabile]|uniref:Uncharacterized protein n=1 Tax=Didymosphaeria variabile TaxID=1932322 RepID=A0A9W9C734_9PLEO|nr:uncharacterized protein N0V89_009975 [Didymosphaeria variabile]KAJ4348597.1 hypothetical protein N0V89_009975 [Didymosphaeria variabile]